MYSNILVPVAFDDERDVSQALNVARKLLKEGGKITAIHVREHLPSYATQYLTKEQMEGNRAQLVNGLLEKTGNSPDIDVVVVEGRSGHRILEEAERREANLIVIASHCPSVQDYFLGSTAARVVRHAKCCVHVVR